MKDYNSIPETADLKEPTDTKFMMAVPMMFNKSKKYSSCKAWNNRVCVCHQGYSS